MLRTAFAILLVGAVATPQPAATPPPTIIRERISPVCTTLHQLVLPLARMEIKNRQIYRQIHLDQALLRKSMATKLQDGSMLYLFRLDQSATNVIANIHGVELQLLKSYAAYPQGKNPKVDALRQRVQNVVDIERVVANNYAAYYGSMVDNDGLAQIENTSTDTPIGAPDLTVTPPPLRPAPLAGLPTPVPPDNDPAVTSTPAPGAPLRVLKYYRQAELQATLETEGHALAQQSLVAARDCDGV